MEQQPGPFDRNLQPEPVAQTRDRAAMIVVIAGVVLGALLLILVLPPVSILSSGSNDSSTTSGPVTATLRDDLPPPPAGYEAVSGLFDLSSPEPTDRPARLTIDLSTNVDEGTQLQFFTYGSDEWSTVAGAVAVAGGNAAQGDVPGLPANVAVLREVTQTRSIVGSLQAGTPFDANANSVLTALRLRGFEPAADGTIVGGEPVAPDVTAPKWAAISTTTPDAVANVNAILNSTELRTAHIQSIRDVAAAYQLAGIDIDYEQVDPESAASFTAFVQELASGLTAEGRSLTLTLPAPVRSGESFDAGAYEWESLAPLVSSITLAPVADGDEYFTRMQDAVGYLVPRVGGGKLMLTVSPLSHERSVDGIRALTLVDAMAIAATPATSGPVAANAQVQLTGANVNGTTGGVHWDDAARAVSFTYTGAGGDRTVWLGNAFSESFKLDLANSYQLAGVVVDDVSAGAAGAGIWPVVSQYASNGAVDLVRPNGDMLVPRWQASAGQLASDVGPAVTWQAPAEEGTYTITLIVSDGITRVGQELPVAVGAAGAVAP